MTLNRTYQEARRLRRACFKVSVLEFLTARSERQRHAFEDIPKAIEAYDVECIDTLVGDIAPPADLMKTQTDRRIAEELERTYEAQREAQIKRQALEREIAVANLQGEVVRSEQMVKVAQQNALAAAEQARGEGNALELRAQGQAASVRLAGDAEASALKAVGSAKAAAYKQGSRRLASRATRRCRSRRSSASTTSRSCPRSRSAATAPRGWRT